MLREKTAGQFKVFIAEDSALMSERLTELFHTLPQVQVCGVAAEVAQAIAAIQHRAMDLVVLDIDLIGGSGLEVLKAIKRQPLAPVAVILTIHPFHDFGQHCLDAGADYFFEKGNGFDALLSLIEELSLRPRLGT